jgi:D-tyrosyl-tRNA(Tyr) deacylase
VRAVVQRVSGASVSIGGAVHSSIGRGLLVLVGVENGDGPEDAASLAGRVLALRIFEDADGRMNLPVTDTGGAILAVSQFTLLGDCRRGRRPSYARAAPPGDARRLYERFVGALSESGVPVSTGVFRETMEVELTNSGPVTLLLDTRGVF